MNIIDVLVPVKQVVGVFEQLSIPHYISGSLASSTYGVPRMTSDVDIVADMHIEHIRSFVKPLEHDFYIDADMIQDAVRRRFEFNLIHYTTSIKVDVFIPKTRMFDQEMLHRIRLKAIVENDRLFDLASPEDTILSKLEWYRMGGETSDRQWNDLLGMLKLQGTTLDFAYLQRWATALQVEDLLKSAYDDAGLEV